MKRRDNCSGRSPNLMPRLSAPRHPACGTQRYKHSYSMDKTVNIYTLGYLGKSAVAAQKIVIISDLAAEGVASKPYVERKKRPEIGERKTAGKFFPKRILHFTSHCRRTHYRKLSA